MAQRASLGGGSSSYQPGIHSYQNPMQRAGNRSMDSFPTSSIHSSPPPSTNSMMYSTSDTFVSASEPKTRAPPVKVSSFQMLRGRGSDPPTLPQRAPEALSAMSPQQNNRLGVSFRAAEHGRGELLPTANKPQMPKKAKSMSSSLLEPSWMTGEGGAGGRSGSAPPGDTKGSQAMSLRSRRKASSDDFLNGSTSIESGNGHYHSSGRHHGWISSDSFNSKMRRSTSYGGGMNSSNWSNFMGTHNRGQLIQTLVILIVTFLVWDSYYRAISMTDRFEQLKHEESMLMLHLQRIEQQSIQLHENLSRLHDGTGIDALVKGERPLEMGVVDSKLIHNQIQTLLQMEEELNHELRGLQGKIQQVSRSSIVSAFGEGPVEINLDLNFPEGSGSENAIGARISVLLWYDTPYAAWTWISQVQKGIWNGAEMKWDRGVSIMATPITPDTETRLDFVEKSQKTHEPWTVGLIETENGGIGMFINLQDNTAYHKHDVCVGKVVDGFDALQRLIDATRQLDGTTQSVTIKVASAAHLSRGKAAIP